MNATPQPPAPARPSLLFDGIHDWLMAQGLHETPLEDVVRGLGHRLVAGGIPVHRIGLASMLLHPVFGALNLYWNADDDTVSAERSPREVFGTPRFQDAPFYAIMLAQERFVRHRLTDEDCPGLENPVIRSFRDRGMTDYLGYFESYGRPDAALWADLPAGLEGVTGSFTTRRAGGFSDDEIAYLKALSRPLSLATKTAVSHELSRAMLEVYLGGIPGDLVLDGLITRGDGRRIDCALWYADMRGSTALASTLPLD